MQATTHNFIRENEIIHFLKSEGINVKTDTKARGNLGICFKDRIDISKNTPKDRRISVLAHEYAHKIHLGLEKEAFKTGGTLEKLFNTNDTMQIKKELTRVTHFVDPNSLFLRINEEKNKLKNKISDSERTIKTEYPDFQRSKDFAPFKKYIKSSNSKAKYFLKYDHIKLINPILRKEEIISINTLDRDFESMPQAFKAYIMILSYQRKQKRLSARKNRLQKYYGRPTELFARLVESLFIDAEKTKLIAPHACMRFFELLENNYYGNLKKLLYIFS